MHDPYGNSAKISGSLNHHSLFNFDYNFKFLLDNLLLINWEKSPSRSFWGQIFTDGPIKIHGDFDKVHIGGELSTSGVHGQSIIIRNRLLLMMKKKNTFVLLAGMMIIFMVEMRKNGIR